LMRRQRRLRPARPRHPHVRHLIVRVFHRGPPVSGRGAGRAS
jgi:hypothetical protein